MSFTNNWDITTPAGTENISQGDDRIRAMKADIEERLESSLYGFNADLTTGDEATAGIKALNFKEQTSIATPSANQIMVAAKEADSKAELFVKNETGTEFQITSGGKLGSATTNLLAAAAAISGAVTVGGTLDVVGNIDPATYETTNGGFLDEDDMNSDAADKVASQQSIKAYVETNTKGGTYGNKNSIGGDLVKATAYTTQVAGYVTAWSATTTGNQITGKVAGAEIAYNNTNAQKPFISFFVPEGLTFQIDLADHVANIRWCSLVNGGGLPVAP